MLGIQRIVSLIMVAILMVHGLSFSLLQLTYEFNPDVFEAHCVNKAKPALSCHGKCCLMKMQQQTNTANQNESDSPENTKRIAFSFEYVVSAVNNLRPSIIEKTVRITKGHLQSFSEVFLNTPGHPPQA